jgi:predicted glycosyltransferase
MELNTAQAELLLRDHKDLIYNIEQLAKESRNKTGEIEIIRFFQDLMFYGKKAESYINNYYENIKENRNKHLPKILKEI